MSSDLFLEQSIEHYKIAIVKSRFNPDITEALLEGAKHHLMERGVKAHHIFCCEVPGAVEIPWAAQRLAKTLKFSAIIALGAVIQGETNHYDYVCHQVSYGCQRVALTQEVPVIFGVLTTQTFQQAQARVGGECGHAGLEAAQAALEMIELTAKIDLSTSGEAFN